jgi:hypothetical protein
MVTEAATFTGYWVNHVIFYRSKVAYVLTKLALNALFLVNEGNLTAPELIFLLSLWLKEKIEVGSVNITVS